MDESRPTREQQYRQKFIDWLESQPGTFAPHRARFLPREHDLRLRIEGLHPDISILVDAMSWQCLVSHRNQVFDCLATYRLGELGRDSQNHICWWCMARAENPRLIRHHFGAQGLRVDHLFGTLRHWFREYLRPVRYV